MNSILLAFAALDPRLALKSMHANAHRHLVAAQAERQAPQRMWFDVDLCVPLAQAAAAHDDIAHTLDYDFIRAVIAQVVGDQHHELQETLCDRIATQLLANPAVQAVRVATRKPDVYPDSASIGVERVALKPCQSLGENKL